MLLDVVGFWWILSDSVGFWDSVGFIRLGWIRSDFVSLFGFFCFCQIMLEVVQIRLDFVRLWWSLSDYDFVRFC